VSFGRGSKGKMNLSQIFLVPHSSMLYGSLFSMIAAYLISYFSLRKKKMGNEALFLSLGSLASGIWLYELVYHYAYGSTLSQFLLDAQRIDISGTTGGVFPLAWAIIMILLPFAGYKWMSVNWFFIGATVAGFSFFVLWILVGFPQFDHVDWSSAWTNYKQVIPIPEQSRLVVAFVLNSLSKILVCAPALLFFPSKKVQLIRRRNQHTVAETIPVEVPPSTLSKKK